MSESHPRIAVVGGGIAGLTAAASLLRAGVPCTVYERATAFADAGAGIQLAPNSVRLLHELGLAAVLDRRATRARAIETRRWDDGRLLARTSLGEACESRHGAPYHLIQRADLHRSLLELLPPGTVRHSSACTSFEEHPDGVTLHFADGSAERADAVVAADGIHSGFRNALVGDRPTFTGLTVYRGLVPADRLPEFSAVPQVYFWLGPGGHVTAYPITGHGLIHFSAVTTSPDWDPDTWSAPGTPEEVAAAFTGWNSEVGALAAAAEEVHHWALFDRDCVGGWCTGRVALAGDAAHPMVPFLSQGANQAIEDAAVLAALLRDCDPDQVPAALRRYEEVRLPRAAAVHRRSRERGGEFHLPDGPEQRARDAAMPGAERLDAYAWLYGYEALPQGVRRWGGPGADRKDIGGNKVGFRHT
ncbi:FAD-dependent monooxygenase [Streptomyces sp. NPDC044571]|uniref:FAD-dependent monooxygenase n=1 Tax=Streptomyces sp. NPDC044571 TaxID=3155371 RepID=UPI0033C46376